MYFFRVMWMGLSLALAQASASGAACFAPAVVAGDVDLPRCATYRDGREVKTDPAAALAALGLNGGRGNWGAGAVEGGGAAGATFDYVVAFKRPVAVGSLLCERREGSGERVVYALKAGAPFPPDVREKKDWEPIAFPPAQSGPRLATLVPGFTTRALRCEEVRRAGASSAGLWRLYAGRLHNALPAADAAAPSEYVVRSMFAPAYTLAAENLTRGTGVWQSNGPEQNVVRGPAITEFDPCWLVAQWDEARDLRGMYLEDNFVKFKLYAWAGPGAINPILGNDDEWTPIRFEQSQLERQTPDGARRGRLVEFAGAVRAKAIKIQILETPANELQIARISALHVYTDLGAGPVPAVKGAEEAVPFKVKYQLPREGMTTAVIDAPGGRRVRNLYAREQRAKGANDEAWDLKDEAGRPVAPGTYTLKLLCNPGLRLRYQMTPYPNVADNTPDNSPWLNGSSGPGGWLADHTSCTSVCAAGDRVYIGAPCSESGVSLIECDLTGRKLWGYGNFLAWTGPHFLAADETYVYAGIGPNFPEHGDLIYRVRLADKQVDKWLDLPGDGRRKRGMAGLAAGGGKVFVAVRGGDDAFANAAVAEDVDAERCVPSYPRYNRQAHSTPATWAPDRRSEFVGLFRMGERVPGHRGLLELETGKTEGARQQIVLAFKKSVSVGSLVFPMNKDVPMRVALLKAGAAADADDESAWETIWQTPAGGVVGGSWAVVPAPPGAQARALRLTFARSFDGIDDALSDEPLGKRDRAGGLGGRADAEEKRPAWGASLEGMKILRRRFASLLPGARVSVNSGAVGADGEWDARRTEPLSVERPGIYAMQWDAPQSVRGLAIKEIDGRLTEIDAYTGPVAGAIDISADAGWKKVATYEQARRVCGAVEAGLGPNNDSARYVDGYVDFGADVVTRAVRLRVVAQWPNNGPPGQTSLGVRADRGGQQVTANRCRVYGVAPVRMIGGEVPVDELTSERVEAWDAATGKLADEMPFPRGGQIALAPDGRLYGISAGRVVEVDWQGKALRPVVTDLIEPAALAVDSAANLFVLDNAPGRKVIRVYDRAGKFLRQLGTPGGYAAGAWDAERIDCATALAVDHTGQLWHTESSYWPKRVVCRGPDGKVIRQFLGNTQYGGGGVLDPADKRRLYYGPLEFEIDWETGKTRLKNLTWQGASAAGELPAYVNGRQYLLTHQNGGQQPDGGAGTVYLYENGRCRAVAAAGCARYYPPFATPQFQAAYGRVHGNAPLTDQKFLWVDANGDGQVQVDEVKFSPMPQGFYATYFDQADLALNTTARVRYEVQSFLPSGVPVYAEKAYPDLPAETGLRLSDGNFLFNMRSDGTPTRNAVFTPAGKELWAYRNEGFGGGALTHASPWTPSKAVAEFDVIGHATAGGGLGEFFVTDDNVGQWNVYSADGMLAGWIFLEIRNPLRKPWSMSEHNRGLALDDVTAGQEHFQGYFTKTSDGHYYVVAGHNHASVVEVLGLDDFQRAEQTFEVSAADLEGLRAHDQAQQRRAARQKPKVLDCYPKVRPLAVDGSAGDWRDQPGGAQVNGMQFKMTYDEKYLYVLYEIAGKGPLKNTGNDWRTLFRSGACVDLQLGTDAQADPGRREPTRGDFRLLMSAVNGKPTAVLYQPVCPGASAAEAKEFHTGVQACNFDRVVKLDSAIVAHRAGPDGYTLEAAIPLAAVGLKVSDGLRLRGDWGVLQSGPGGSEVVDHLWWSNAVPVPFDEAAEAKLHPDLWGTVRFHAGPRAEQAGPQQGGASRILEPDSKPKRKPGDVVDELESGGVK